MKELPKRIVWKRAPDPNSRREQSRLTPEEQANVRQAMGILRVRFGNWGRAAVAMHANKRTMTRVLCNERQVTPAFAARIARVLHEPLAAVLLGEIPRANECPLCGHRKRIAAGIAVGTKETGRDTVARLRRLKGGTRERRMRIRGA